MLSRDSESEAITAQLANGKLYLTLGTGRDLPRTPGATPYCGYACLEATIRPTLTSRARSRGIIWAPSCRGHLLSRLEVGHAELPKEEAPFVGQLFLELFLRATDAAVAALVLDAQQHRLGRSMLLPEARAVIFAICQGSTRGSL